VPGTPARLEATHWAFDVLADRLGADWPERAMAKRVAGHLLSAISSPMGNSHLLWFAIRLRLIGDVPGGKKAVRPLRSNDLTGERILGLHASGRLRVQSGHGSGATQLAADRVRWKLEDRLHRVFDRVDELALAEEARRREIER
jgi:hypothetical protein